MFIHQTVRRNRSEFKINLCVDALEDGTLDVSGDCMMDNRENTRKEFSLKDMQEV